MRSSFWLATVCSVAIALGCTGSGSDQSQKCEGPLGPPISISGINAMEACCQAEGGKAHCLEAGKVPSEIQPVLATCAGGGYCIPDSFLETGAAEPPQQCTAFGGPAVCLSKCVPQVSQNAGLLRKDVCTGADDLCVPCTNPLDGKPTGACDLLELAHCVGDDPGSTPTTRCDDPATCNYEASCPDVVDPATLTSCGPDAHCMDASFITDPAQAAQLGKCADGVKLCVPDVFLRTGGKFTAPACTSVNGAEGRCLSAVLPAVKDQADLLPQSTCAATEKCTPCYSPIDGAPTGACKISCDAGPTQPPKLFAQCCSGRARCVPTSSIPAGDQDQLSEQECETAQPDSLCVPNEILADGPFPTCSASSIVLGNYTGVCLSDCLDFGIQGIALARGNCQQDFKCAPCVRNGQPTGAPGCPP